MNGFFITATGTGIGKTVLTALLLAELRRRGISAAPVKPVQTGVGEQDSGDLDCCLSMAGMTVSPQQYAWMNPYRFKPACSPHLAAELAGTEIQIATIGSAVRELAAQYDLLLVEGAGGVLVPLNRRETMLDLIKMLNLPVLIAACPGLGTINHTLLSLSALRHAGATVAGIVLVESGPAERGFIEEDNITTLEQFGGIPVLGTIPFCPQLRKASPVYSSQPVPVVAETEKIVNKLSR